jgi:hypothetical protein
MTPPRFTLQVLSGKVTVESESADLLAELAGLFSLFPGPRGGRDPARATFRIEAQRDGVRRLSRDGEILLETDCDGYMLARAEHEILGAAVGEERRHLVFHAAAVALGGRGVLLVGGRGAGKTTLAARLAGAGFTYYADEMSAVDTRTRRLTPLPRTLNVKPQTVRLLAGCDLRIGSYDPDPSRYPARYALPPAARVGREPVEVGLVLFPRRADGRHAGLTAIRASQAAVLLVRHAYNFPAMPDRGFALVAGLLERAPAFVLEHDDLSEATRMVREIL